ncbi:DUF1878 family protein [Priestia aryabhattai]|uniref:DUF1878 family protein n=1 Tax=Priestia aryabhattai TaxID=412384 RepID=A0AAX6NDW2_PRIAR|nr:DUF1878 family protein [Priestia aryabhattai]MDU9694088.1 DUF1878 family protein [Priestia aryabhattai]NGY88616.1 DUF1878 family protein [Priestia megaterium]
MDVVKEIQLLKYQNKLLQSLVNGDEFPFFMFALNHSLNETQVNSILKVVNVFDFRLKEETDENFNKFVKQHNEDKANLNELGVDSNSLFKNELPTLEEFKSYVGAIYTEAFEIEYLLQSLKKQEINTKVCSYLLEQSK